MTSCTATSVAAPFSVKRGYDGIRARECSRALRGAGLTVDTLLVRAHDTTGPTHTLYVATPRE